MRQAHIAAAIAAGAGIAAHANARIVVEDFMDPTATSAAFDPFFTYDFGTGTDYTGSDANGLFPGVMTLTPDLVTIGLGLGAQESVVAASVTIRDFAGPNETRIMFLGDQGMHTVTNNSTGVNETFVLDVAWGIGDLQQIKIDGRQTFVYEIMVETEGAVPTPATGVLAAMGLGMTTVRRRRA